MTVMQSGACHLSALPCALFSCTTQKSNIAVFEAVLTDSAALSQCQLPVCLQGWTTKHRTDYLSQQISGTRDRQGNRPFVI